MSSSRIFGDLDSEPAKPVGLAPTPRHLKAEGLFGRPPLRDGDATLALVEADEHAPAIGAALLTGTLAALRQ